MMVPVTRPLRSGSARWAAKGTRIMADVEHRPTSTVATIKTVK